MNNALRKTKAAATAALAFFVSAVLWIVILFVGGAASIVAGVLLMLGQGPALVAAGIAMLSACILLKRAVTNGQ